MARAPGATGGHLESGALVGDDLMIPWWASGSSIRHGQGFVLDGFPRTIPQAGGARRAPWTRPVSDRVGACDEVIRRLAGRRRQDDDACVIKERLAVYARDTEPVLEYYRRRDAVKILDGNGPR
jgi:adenylate kinase